MLKLHIIDFNRAGAARNGFLHKYLTAYKDEKQLTVL